MQGRSRRPSPALVVAIIALIASLGGSAWAATSLKKNSVGAPQLKSKSVTTGKIAPNAVNGSKVKDGSLTGADINLEKLGTVPSAAEAERAGTASALVDSEGKLRTAGCPAGAIPIRGICFDTQLNSPAVHEVQQAADACAAKGGFLPTVMELYSARGSINLGQFATPPNFAITDSLFADPVNKSHYSVMGVQKDGTIEIFENTTEAKYICAYPLVR